MARKCKEDAEKTRLAIIDAALDVFSERGYAKATFDEIAARAGFTKGAVYWYFRNKADLVASLIIEYFEKKRLEIALNIPEADTLEDLLEYFVLWAKASREDLRFAKFNRFTICQMEWSEAVVNRVQKSLLTQRDFHLEKIKNVLVKLEKRGELKENIDVDMISEVIRSVYVGIIFSSLNGMSKGDIVEKVRLGLSCMLNGIKK